MVRRCRSLRSLLFFCLVAALFATSVAHGQPAPPSIELRDDHGPITTQAYQFSHLQVFVTDAAAAGAGQVQAQVSSLLRGASRSLTLYEQSPGRFGNAILLYPVLPSDPPTLYPFLEILEDPGPPVRFDTVRVEYACGAPPCPAVTVGTVGATLRLVVPRTFTDLDTVAVGSPVGLILTDYSSELSNSTTFTFRAEPSGDVETVTVYGFGPDVAYALPTRSGPAIPNDGYLELDEPGTLTVTHDDPLHVTVVSDSAFVGVPTPQFLDRQGRAVDHVLVEGLARLRLLSPAADTDPGAVDSVAVTVRSRDGARNVRDTETVQLVETGPNTGVFRGQIQTHMYPFPTPGDGQLQTWALGVSNPQLDTVEATLGDLTTTAALLPGFLRLVDSTGADVTVVVPGDRVDVLLESDLYNQSPTLQEPVWIRVRSDATGDEEYPIRLLETGVDTGIFQGSFQTSLAPSATPGDRLLEVQSGETLRAVQETGYGTAVDTAQVLGGGNAGDVPPVLGDDTATTPRDVPVAIDVLANDSDPDGDAFSIELFTQPTGGGTVTQTGPGTLTYTPPAGRLLTDSFLYKVVDERGAEEVGTVTVFVVPPPPVAVDDALATAEDTAGAVNVLGNDSDPTGYALTVTGITQPAHGSASLSGSTVTYTPAANYNGSDALIYTINNGHGGTATGTVQVTVTPVNDPPVAVGDSATTAEDTAVAVSVLANDSDVDGDSLTVTGVTQPAHGTASFTASSVTYTPASNYNGADGFTYTISDGHGGTATGTVSVTVTAVNDPPVAVADSATTPEDTAVTVSVLANDSDVDGDSLAVTGVTQPAHGTASFTAAGVTYTPASNYNGADAFTYTISDGHGGTATGTVSMTVTAVNDPPVAGNDVATTREGVAVTVAVLANDGDVEGSPLTVTAVGTPAHGTATRTASSVTYTPANNFNGTDSFTYTVSDGSATSTGTVTVVVTDALERVAVLATNSVWLQSGSDVLSGDVIVNQAGSGPFLNGGVELSVAGTVTTPAGWDLEANRIAIAAGSTVASDVFYNQLTNAGTLTGQPTSTWSFPVFASLPAFQTATPGTTDVTVANNGSRTLAPGSYRDLVVGRKGTVVFTGGTYHFRSIRVTDTGRSSSSPPPRRCGCSRR